MNEVKSYVNNYLNSNDSFENVVSEIYNNFNMLNQTQLKQANKKNLKKTTPQKSPTTNLF